jgi:hypothetical protein
MAKLRALLAATSFITTNPTDALEADLGSALVWHVPLKPYESADCLICSNGHTHHEALLTISVPALLNALNDRASQEIRARSINSSR